MKKKSGVVNDAAMAYLPVYSLYKGLLYHPDSHSIGIFLLALYRGNMFVGFGYDFGAVWL